MYKSRWLIIGVAILAAAASSNETLYKIEPGPYDVRIVDELTLNDAVQGRDVTLRVLYPDGAGPFPLVVYSTGAFCWPQMYDRVTTHWVSHGYVVITPNHLDSPNNAELRPDQLVDLLPSRLRDVSFVVDELDEISEQANIAGKIDAERIAIGGHSFGAVISMVKTGLYLKDEYKGSWGEPYDARFQAAVLMSAPGPGMEQMTDNAFDGLSKPLIATGGTNDVGRVDPGEYPRAEWRTVAYQLAPPGDKYSIIVQDADHYLGGLICNPERGGEPDPEGVAIVRAMTTAFLDAYIKDDAAALEFLNSADVSDRTNGRALYQYR
jgi:pimeloyl-ACP methyl ester carboxylesterase